MQIDRNPDREELIPLLTASRAAPHPTESSTRISDPIGDIQQKDDQYRSMTLEEEILRIYEYGISTVPQI